jgi:hypothetical protein
MKTVTPTALLLVLGAIALAKPSPIERSSLVLADADIKIGWVGAVLSESDDFHALQSSFNAGAFPCRLTPVLFHTTRLAQSCR